MPSTPKATLTLENVLQSGALWTQGAGTGSSQATSNAHGNNVATELHSAPEWGPLSLDLGGKGLRRHRADGRIEWLFSRTSDARVGLPWGFSLTGTLNALREGAPDDYLFRWQPALGLYPNPD